MREGDVVADRFVLGRLAGAGGMGAVYRGVDRASGTAVAVKFLTSGDVTAGARFVREAALLAELDHPGIVRYLAHGVYGDGTPFLVMEWLEGEDLAVRLARGALSLDEATTVVRAIAAPLAVLHARGLVHRDVKPSNVFLVGKRLDDVRLLDFGLARSVQATYGLTGTGAVLGTVGFMAPEQIRGEGGVGPFTDVFALGALFYECIAGRPAFEGDHAVAILAKVLFDETPRLVGISASLEAIVARMLAKDPSSRPADGAAVIAALDQGDDAAPSSRESAVSERERRTAIVIVATARRVTDELAHTLSPEDAAHEASLLRAALAEVEPSAEILGGAAAAVIRSTGTLGDHAVRAARCALAVRRRFPDAAVAIACGAKESGGLLGDAVDRAVRGLAAMGESGVNVDEATAGLLGDRFDVSSDGSLIAERSPNGDRPRGLLGRETPCVGRDRELRMLRDFLDDVASEPAARAIVVTGPAGAGKTRVRHEIVQRARGFSLWMARADAMSAGSAGELIASLLRSVLGVHHDDPPETRVSKVKARVPDARTAELLGELAGCPFGASASAELRAVRANAFALFEQERCAFAEFLRAECAVEPVAIVLEDLHWGDLPSMRIIEGALRELADAPLAVLAFARPEVHEHFGAVFSSIGAQELRLPPLSRRACEDLARAVLGADVTPSVIERLTERSAGHAFYLEELIRWEAEGRREGAPDTVIGMVQTRLEALDTDARRVLRAASVFGETFWAGGVAALTSQDALDASLGALVERELVVSRDRSRLANERELAFRHALVRDAAYATISESDRRPAHAAAARWLEGAGERDPRTLAEHLALGGELDGAAVQYERAARAALRQHDPVGAREMAERGLALGVKGDDRVRLVLTCGEADHWSARFGETLARGREALELTAPPSPLFYRAAWTCLVGALHRVCPFEDVLERVRASPPRLSPDPPSVRIAALLIPAVYQVGDCALGDLVHDQLTGFAAGVRDADPSTRAALAWIGSYRAFYGHGDPWAAARLSDAAHADYVSVSDHTRGAQVGVEAAFARLLLGDAEGARERLERALAQKPAFPMGLSEQLARVLLLRASRALGEVEAVLSEAPAMISQLSAGASKGGTLIAVVVFGNALCDHGEHERARDLLAPQLTSGLDLIPFFSVELLCALARAERALGERERARELALRAVAPESRGRALGCARFLAHEVLAECCLALGHEDEARAALAGIAELAHRIRNSIDDPKMRALFDANSDAMRAARLAVKIGA